MDATEREPVERDFFEHKAKALLVLCAANERPLRGLAGRLDWRLQGKITFFLKRGWITGAEGELTYLPCEKNGETLHLLLLGVGEVTTPGTRSNLDPQLLANIRTKIEKISHFPLALSKKELGQTPVAEVQKALKGIPLWIK